MWRCVGALPFAGLCWSMGAAHAAPPLTIPALREWVPATGHYRLGPESRIVAPGELAELAATLADEIRLQTGYGPSVIEANDGASDAREQDVTSGAAPAGDIRLTLDASDADLGTEGYRLTLGRDAHIAAATSAGVFYGTRSLLQLLVERLRLAAGTARDWPDYSERALMLDVGRKFFDLAFIERHIRDLAYVKGNYLHLHLSEVDALGGYGFRLESVSHPELTSDLHYSKSDLDSILELARRYHVMVVPEIDLPGHAKSIVAPHPELALAGTTDKLDVSNPAVYTLVGELLDEYLPQFDAPYWHGGGDEYLLAEGKPCFLPNGVCDSYADHPELLAAARERYGSTAKAEDLFVGFVNWMDERVRSHGKTLRVWGDVYDAPGAVNTPNPDIVLELWREAIAPEDAIARGHQINNSQSSQLYYALGYAGLLTADPVNLYEEWLPNRQWLKSLELVTWPPALTFGPDLPPRAPGLLGAKFHVWCDFPDEETPEQVQDNISVYLRAFAQNSWGSPKPVADYATFYDASEQLGREPSWGPRFSITPEAYEREIASDEPDEFLLSIVPVLGLRGPVALGCTSDPAGVRCSVSPASVMLDGSNPVPVRVSVNGSVRAALYAPSAGLPWLSTSLPAPVISLLALTALGLFGGLVVRRPTHARARTRSALLCGMAAGVLVSLPASCRSDPPDEVAPGEYTLRVSGAAATAARQLELYVRVR